MNTQIYLNRYLLDGVEVTEHPEVEGMFTLTLTENGDHHYGATHELTISGLDHWQDIADALATHGIVGRTYAAERAYDDAEVERHAAGLCEQVTSS